MLSSILSKSDCATCRFCCSFRRQSLWETPIFDASTVEKLRVLYPKTKFRPVGKASYTFDISEQYKTNDPKEEAPCPFLNIKSGCVLPTELKPFDCSIWPFRAVRRTETDKQPLYVALTPTCPAINKVPQAKINSLVQEEGLGKKILDYAKEHPDIIKDWSEFLSNNVYEEN